ncbi:MAG TPA: HDOD domain-containing protein [Candidatus Hydrogenedentes bacterium]|nr:HDOD domain-containing protein [Candidatus Hydrogenedentota bacterium]HOL76355.1 HDOD domain-containing protein [Candidatus Hydrogenedentota bacterium]HPO85393.1 HDOD domain-containing protein [Candidatus Hydrogenedentota bacterium]
MVENRPMVVVSCACGQKMKAPAAIIGKTTQCVKCGAKFLVTEGNSRPLDIGRSSGAAAPSTTTPASSATPTPKPVAKRPRLNRFLLEKGLVTEVQLREAEAEKERRGGRIIDILMEQGHLSKDALLRALNEQTGLPSIDLKNFQIAPQIVSLIPRDFAFERLVLPIDRVGNILTVAMALADDTDTIQMVERMTRLRVTAMLCRLGELDAAIERYFPPAESEQEEADYWPASMPSKTSAPPTPSAPSVPPPPPTPSAGSATVSAPTPRAPSEEDLRQHDKVLSLISALETLPASQQIMERMQAVAQDPHFPARDLATICATEPAVVAKMLGVTNAAAYGMPDKVDNAYLAATLLGTSGMVRVVRMCSPSEAPALPSCFDYERFSLRSRFCAAAAQSIARAGGEVAFATALTAGLLYRIGELAMAIVLPEAYKTVEPNTDGVALLEAEQRAYGLTHADAGGILLRTWRLPERLAEAVRLYPHPERAAEHDPLAAVVASAAFMTAQALSKHSPDEFELHPALLAVCGLSQDKCRSILRDTLTTFRI